MKDHKPPKELMQVVASLGLHINYEDKRIWELRSTAGTVYFVASPDMFPILLNVFVRGFDYSVGINPGD